MLAGFLARRAFLSSALPDLSLASWLVREILSCACLPAAPQAVAPAAYSAPYPDAEPVVAVLLQTGQSSLFRVLGSPFRPLWPLRLLAILRWLRPPFLSIAADRDDHSSAVAADYGRLFLDADYVSVEATPVAPERFSIIDRASLGEIVVSLTTHVSRTLPPRFEQTLPSFSCWSPDLSGRVSASTSPSSPSLVLGASLP